MTEKELKEVLRLHDMWLRGENGGVRANLSGADLSWANLIGANLRWANLSGADLSGANLRWAIGNMAQVKSVQVDGWMVAYTHDTMAIGCQQHPIAEWWEFSDEAIADMERNALEWWKKWKPMLQQIIEISPAVGPEVAE